MDLQEACATLRREGWLSHLPAPLQDDWLSGARLSAVPRGAEIFATEAEPRFMAGIARGTVGAYLSYDPQETRLATLYGAGNWFGDAAVVTANPHRGTAVARTDCVCLIVPAAHVDAVATRHPDLWRWLAQNVLYQFDSFSTLTVAALHRDPGCRLIIMLLGLGRLNPRHRTFTLSTEEIGQMVGLTRNTVGKCLAELSRAGLIERRYRSLTIGPVQPLEAELARRSAR